MDVPVTTLTRSQFSLFLPNDQSIRWAESLQSAVQSFVSSGGGGSLTPSGVTPGNYGTNSSVGAFTVDVNGIITAAADTPIAITFAAVSGVVPIVQGGTGQTTANAAVNALLPIQVGNTGFYLQTDGTNTSWQPAPGGGGGGTVTQVNTTAGEITGGPITVTGTLGLATTGVTAATYGSASSVAQVAFDSKGRATSASSIPIAITGAQVSGNIAGAAGSVAWGTITGAIGSQADLTSALALKAPLASPTFTGVPAAPTAAGGTNTTQLATTAFVTSAVSGKANSAITITGATSLTGGGDLTANRTLALVNDAASPGNSFYYGTNSSGTKGYFVIPTPGASVTTVAAGFGIAVANPTGPTATVSDPWNVYANIMDYDPTGTANLGIIDATTAYDAARTAIGNQGTIYFPPGFYRGAFTIPTPYLNLRGAGLQATVLRPLSVTDTVILMTNALLGIEPCYISDMRIEGIGSYQGIGIDMIAGAGHVIVQRCYIKDLEKCVSRPFGNFGFWSIDTQYGDADYHFYNIGAVDSHSGVFVITRGRRKGARLASYYLDSTTIQTGQIVFENGVVENNPGYPYFVKNGNTNEAAVPDMEVRNEWNENNATSGSITVGGVTAAPRWGHFDNLGAVQVIDTPLSDVTLIHANLLTDNCDLSFIDATITTFDNDSSLTHDRPRSNTDTRNVPGYVTKTQGRTTVSSGNGTWADMPQTIKAGAQLIGGTLDLVNDASAVITFTGTATINTTAVTETGIIGLATAQQLVMTGAQTENGPNTGATAIPAGSYVAWVMVARLVSGTAPTLSYDGGNTMTIGRPVSNADYATMKGMATYAASLSFIGPRFVSTASCTVNIAGFAIAHFTKRQDCLNWLNSETFPA